MPAISIYGKQAISRQAFPQPTFKRSKYRREVQSKKHTLQRAFRIPPLPSNKRVAFSTSILWIVSDNVSTIIFYILKYFLMASFTSFFTLSPNSTILPVD